MLPPVRRIALPAALIAALVVVLSGCGEESGTTNREGQAAISRYRAYLEKSADELVTWLGQLRARVAAGDVPGAQSRFASSRVPYGHLEPAAVLFDLDARMDGRPGAAVSARSPGYDGLEHALWSDAGTRNAIRPASRLLASARELRQRVGGAPLPPGEIVGAARQVLDDVVRVELRGLESPYAHIDVADTAADVEGAEAAFDAVKPLLEAEDAELTAALERRFAAAFRTLSDFGVLARSPEQQRIDSPGTSFVLFTVRSPAEIANLRQRVEAVARLLAQAEEVRRAGS
ncbi:MAG TPA: EfeM/EfeO family lipoprotein [Solirubrobacterales bacterium]|nr:EfeM/EfeO family lipoprotein [Solirubrobacterales bacterium]